MLYTVDCVYAAICANFGIEKNNNSTEPWKTSNDPGNTWILGARTADLKLQTLGRNSGGGPGTTCQQTSPQYPAPGEEGLGLARWGHMITGFEPVSNPTLWLIETVGQFQSLLINWSYPSLQCHSALPWHPGQWHHDVTPGFSPEERALGVPSPVETPTDPLSLHRRRNGAQETTSVHLLQWGQEPPRVPQTGGTATPAQWRIHLCQAPPSSMAPRTPALYCHT